MLRKLKISSWIQLLPSISRTELHILFASLNTHVFQRNCLDDLSIVFFRYKSRFDGVRTPGKSQKTLLDQRQPQESAYSNDGQDRKVAIPLQRLTEEL